jgi:hypothetical protein
MDGQDYRYAPPSLASQLPPALLFELNPVGGIPRITGSSSQYTHPNSY